MATILNDQTITALTKVFSTGASTAYVVTARDNAIPSAFRMDVVKRGTCTFACQLEGSDDGSTWIVIGKLTDAGTVRVENVSWAQVRVNVASFTNASPGNDITVSIKAYDACACGKFDGGFGSKLNIRTITEEITLSTSGATTDSTANLLPANSIILGVSARVTTTITTATDWAVGDGSTAARFTAANSTLTAGTTSVGLAHWAGTVAMVQAAAAKLRITTTGTPGAGKIRVSVNYIVFTPPTA
jgi:hypothetical protein